MIRTSINIDGSRLVDKDFTSVFISQEVSKHNTFEIRLRQDPKKGILLDKAQSWIGKGVVIGLDAEEDIILVSTPVKEYFKGIITSVGLSRRSGTAELIVRGQSPTIVMDDGPDTASFENMGLQEIIDKVIGPYVGAFPTPPTVSPQSNIGSIQYCVQYKESAFRFIQRLAERYGEWFYFDGLKCNWGELPGGSKVDLDFGENSLQYFDLSVEAVPSKFEMRGYDYEKDEVFIEEAPQTAPKDKLGSAVYDIAKSKIFPNTPSVSIQTDVKKKEFKNIIERREIINIDEMVIFNGASRHSGLRVGTTISVADAILAEVYGDFVIVNITHHIGQGGDYSNSFEAIPAEMKHPPLMNMPQPPHCEKQLARVVKIDDPDALGRIRVKFLWQEGTPEMSPWIRVATPYAGQQRGFYMIPEIDDHVLIAFENNNPDKPYMALAMYNKTTAPEHFHIHNDYSSYISRTFMKFEFNDGDRIIKIYNTDKIELHADTEISLNVKNTNIILTETQIEFNTEMEVHNTTNVEFHNQENYTIYSNQFMIEADIVFVTGSSSCTLEGDVITITGYTKTDIKGGGGTALLQGGMVKLNS